MAAGLSRKVRSPGSAVRATPSGTSIVLRIACFQWLLSPQTIQIFPECCDIFVGQLGQGSGTCFVPHAISSSINSGSPPKSLCLRVNRKHFRSIAPVQRGSDRCGAYSRGHRIQAGHTIAKRSSVAVQIESDIMGLRQADNSCPWPCPDRRHNIRAEWTGRAWWPWSPAADRESPRRRWRECRAPAP